MNQTSTPTLTATPVSTLEDVVTVDEVVKDPDPKPPEITRKQLGQLRRHYVTVVHGKVTTCGHKAKFMPVQQRPSSPPNNNCIHCWRAYFYNCVDLEGIHVILTQKGVKELIKQKGEKFTRMFHGFLSEELLPALAKGINENEVAEEPVKIEGVDIGQNREVQNAG